MVKASEPQVRSEILDLVEQLTDQLQAGNRSAIQEILRQHPEEAPQLREILPSLEILAEFQQSAGEETSARPGYPQGLSSADPVQGVLGDFRIIRQIGRGGMGVVYEAQQISIQRTVALKVLPLASLVDSKALQRFKNEVTAIATLEHPHIVSVYAVGEERGIHYYAMRLIRGQSLAAVIRELRMRAENQGSVTGESLNHVVSDMEDQSNENEKTGSGLFGAQHPQGSSGQRDLTPLSKERVGDLDKIAVETQARGRSTTGAEIITDQSYFRNVVRLILQAADALQHAHDHGIVHRDVKPGNLLLDKQSSLFVTDFGLARIETGAGVTMTGDVLGTLRYMSPEQVLANRVVIDHRTDVYSLGATLFELLTLQPMWTGANKAELIRQISFEEPELPCQINPAIPMDLETIVLKAISKNPAERYESAQAIADDLTNFRDHKPILARRPTTVQRIAKWTRRNPSIAISTAVILLLTTIGLVVSNVLILRQKNIADRKTVEVREQSQRAENSLDQALEAVESLLTRIADEVLLTTPGADQLRKQLYEDALAISESIIDNESSHPAAQRRAAAAHFSVGNINQQLGKLDAADEAFRNSISLWEHWLSEFPDHHLVQDSRARLAKTYGNRSVLLLARGQVPEAIQQLRQATQIWEELIEDSTTDVDRQIHLDLALANVNHGSLLRKTGDVSKALTEITIGIDQLDRLVSKDANNADYRVWLAWAHGHLALGYRDLGQRPKAVQHLENSISILDQSAVHATNSRWSSLQLAETLRDLGRLFTNSEPTKAKLLMQRAVDEIEELCKKFPDVPTYSKTLGEVLINLGKIHEELGEFDSSRVMYDKTVALRRSMVQAFPAQHEWRDDLAWGLSELASLLHRMGERAAADKAMLECIELREQLVSDFSSFPDYRESLSTAYESSASYLLQYHREYEQAEEVARKSIPVLKALVDEFPDNPEYAKLLADIHGLIGAIFLENDQAGEAKVELIHALSIGEELADIYPIAESYEKMMVRIRANLATCHCILGDWDNATKIFLETIEFLDRLGAKHPNIVGYRINCAATHNNLGNVYKETKQFALAEEQFMLALQKNESVLNQFPNNAQLKTLISQDHYSLACLLAISGDTEGALDALDRALEVDLRGISKQLRTDSDLDTIRQHERFQKILVGLENGDAAGDK